MKTETFVPPERPLLLRAALYCAATPLLVFWFLLMVEHIWNPDVDGDVLTFMVSILIILTMLFTAVVRGSSKARWVYIFLVLLLTGLEVYLPDTNAPSTIGQVGDYASRVFDLAGCGGLVLPASNRWYTDLREEWLRTDADWRTAYYKQRMAGSLRKCMLLPVYVAFGRAFGASGLMIILGIVPLLFMIFGMVAWNWWQSRRQEPGEAAMESIPASPSLAARPKEVNHNVIAKESGTPATLVKQLPNATATRSYPREQVPNATAAPSYPRDALPNATATRMPPREHSPNAAVARLPPRDAPRKTPRPSSSAGLSARTSIVLWGMLFTISTLYGGVYLSGFQRQLEKEKVACIASNQDPVIGSMMRASSLPSNVKISLPGGVTEFKISAVLAPYVLPHLRRMAAIEREKCAQIAADRYSSRSKVKLALQIAVPTLLSLLAWLFV